MPTQKEQCTHETVLDEKTFCFVCLVCGTRSEIKTAHPALGMFEISALHPDHANWTFRRVYNLLGDKQGWRMGLFADEIIHEKERVWFYLGHGIVYLYRCGSFDWVYKPGFWAFMVLEWRARKLKQHMNKERK